MDIDTLADALPSRKSSLIGCGVALCSLALWMDASGMDAGAHRALDWSGRARVGVASFYAETFAGRKMADGGRMDPNGDNAASRTLPLGTSARVTNLETGRSTVVTIRDRGPYAKGRIVDLSPSTARRIGISRAQGLARVEVAPLSLPAAPAAPK